MNSKTIKVASAAIGASAVVAMGTLTAALSHDSGSATVVSSTEMTLGETSTNEKAASTPETCAGRIRAQGPEASYLASGGASPIRFSVTVAPVRVASMVTVSFGATD